MHTSSQLLLHQNVELKASSLPPLATALRSTLLLIEVAVPLLLPDRSSEVRCNKEVSQVTNSDLPSSVSLPKIVIPTHISEVTEPQSKTESGEMKDKHLRCKVPNSVFVWKAQFDAEISEPEGHLGEN